MYIELLKAQILDHNAAMLMIEARIVNWLPDELKKSTPTKLHKPLPSSSSSEDSSSEPGELLFFVGSMLQKHALILSRSRSVLCAKIRSKSKSLARWRKAIIGL
jgi:hypothetical protein